jgi:outer membrane lipoprotein-sorting protein
LKKILSLVLVVAMVLGCIGIIACGGGGGEGEAPPSEEEEEAPPSEEEEEPPSGEDLSEILGRGAGIASVKYDMVMTARGAPAMTTHWWVKQNKVRFETTEEGQTVIMLIDYDARIAYTYMPEQNIAYQATFTAATQSAIEQAQSIADFDYTVIGTDTVDGKVCTVVEYSIEQASVKMWIWKEHGFPIRIETTMAEDKTITEYKNIDFADIDDSMFELPAGVQIIQMPGS